MQRKSKLVLADIRSQLPGMAFLLGSIGLFFVVQSDLMQMQWTTQTILLAVYLGAVTMGIANGIQIVRLAGNQSRSCFHDDAC
jgi:hypothetical protein